MASIVLGLNVLNILYAPSTSSCHIATLPLAWLLLNGQWQLSWETCIFHSWMSSTGLHWLHARKYLYSVYNLVPVAHKLLKLLHNAQVLMYTVNNVGVILLSTESLYDASFRCITISRANKIIISKIVWAAEHGPPLLTWIDLNRIMVE